MRQTLFLAALLCAAAPSFAATVTTSGSFTGTALLYDSATDYSPSTAAGGYFPPGSLGGYDGLITLQGFDTSLGTLNSVSLTRSLQISLEFKDAVDLYGIGNIEINAHGSVADQAPYGSGGFSIPFTFDVANTTYYAVTHQTYDTGVQSKSAGPSTYSNNDPLTFAPFLGGQIFDPILGDIQLDSSTGSFLTNATSAYTFGITISYDYTPNAVTLPGTGSVPEPFTLAIFGAGLAGAAAMRRFKARGI